MIISSLQICEVRRIKYKTINKLQSSKREISKHTNQAFKKSAVEVVEELTQDLIEAKEVLSKKFFH